MAMRNEKNIAALKAQLLSLGFPGGLEGSLRTQICFGAERFTLQCRQQREDDTLQFTLYFQREAGALDYNCLYYEACLRRRMDIPSVHLREVDVFELEQRMKRVDWHHLIPGEFGDNPSPADPATWEREEALEGIISDLNKLAESEEGTALAARLKLKFWTDTPLENLIPNVAAQKSGWEISQRFYFFDNEAGISLDEAYRFLLHRWREKNLIAQKKALRPADGLPNGSPPTASGKAFSKKGSPKAVKGKK